MTASPKQTPLGVNVQSSLLQNIGLKINPIVSAIAGISYTNSTYTFGTIISDTCLKFLTYAINDAYVRGQVSKTPAGSSTYDSLISIGSTSSPLMGNSKPPTFSAVDPSGEWTSAGTPANTGYADELNPLLPTGQTASWLPYNTVNPNDAVTQWGFIRNFALQAWNEFNWNGNPSTPQVNYRDFLSSFMIGTAFVDSSNASVGAVTNSSSFLQGTYSNVNDLSSADITGVSLATSTFGQDCIVAGKVIDLSKIDRFGLPSVLLQTIKKYNAMSQSLTLALLSAGLTPDEIDGIATGRINPVNPNQEQLLYGSFLVIVGVDLIDVLVPLNCKTQGLTSLADLLDVRKLFPNSYQSLTVPIYNTTSGPTNSKTYYPIFENNGVSPRLISPAVSTQIGTVVPINDPPVYEPTQIFTVTSIPNNSSGVGI